MRLRLFFIIQSVNKDSTVGDEVCNILVPNNFLLDKYVTLRYQRRSYDQKCSGTNMIL